MISLNANTRDNKTKGQLNAIRDSGNVPAILFMVEKRKMKKSLFQKNY